MSDFGKDIACTDSLRTGSYARGLRVVAEACYRRLTTPRGMLRGGEEEEDYGFDLAGYVGSTNPKAAEASMPGRIQTELLKDERVESVSVEVTTIADASSDVSFTVAIDVVTGEGPFTLQIGVSAVTVDLIGFSEA